MVTADVQPVQALPLVLPTVEAAHEMGALGAPLNKAEQTLFEAYMHGREWERGAWSDKLRCYEDQSTRIMYAMWRDRAALGLQTGPRAPVTRYDARAKGEYPAPHNEHERLLFEAYMRGHCWAYGVWSEKDGNYRRTDKPDYPDASATVLYMVWRDRAALECPVEVRTTGLHSTHIYEDRDCVRATALKVDDRVLTGQTELQLAQELRALAKHWKSRLELPSRHEDEYDPKYQTFLHTERGDWVPVDHFLWGTRDDKECIRLEFTADWCYFHEGTRPLQRTRKKHQALRLFASALLRRAQRRTR